MTTKSMGLVETVKDGVVGAVKGTGEIAKATADTVGSTLSTTLKDAGKVGASATEAIGHVAGGAIDGAAQVESPRVFRRPYCLRGWGHGKTQQVFTRGSGAVRPDGA